MRLIDTWEVFMNLLTQLPNQLMIPDDPQFEAEMKNHHLKERNNTERNALLSYHLCWDNLLWNEDSTFYSSRREELGI